MCNLYNLSTNHEAVRRLFRVDPQLDLPLDWGAVYPDRDALVVRRNEDGARALDVLRWGFPPPPRALSRQVTNVRNVTSPFWRPWLKKPWRCLAAFTAFCENDASRTPHWFATSAQAPLAAFAAIWRPWTGERLVAQPGQARRSRESRDWALFAFLTTEPNSVVAPIHPKAMPVVLTEPDECDIWLDGDDDQALALHRPLAAERLVAIAGV